MKAFHLNLLILTAALFNFGCEPTEEAVEVERKSPSTYFPISLGDTTLHLQFALHDAERTKGLKYRDGLETDHGMLFIFEDIGPKSFWMRDTRIPLDLAYLSPDGTLLEVHKLYPYDEEGVPSHSKEVLMVVEMTRGWFELNAVEPGAKLDIKAVVSAIKARGLDPEKFPLVSEN